MEEMRTINLDKYDYRLILNALNEFRNIKIQENVDIEIIDKLMSKLLKAPVNKKMLSLQAMKQDEKRIMRVLYVIGIIPIIWIALLLAPYTKGGLIEIIKNGSAALNQPFKIVIVENSIRTILIFLIIYIFSILLYESTRKNYRRREENGSAKWGEAKELNKKYKQPNNYNKLLTKNVSVGLNGRKHRRNHSERSMDKKE